VFACPTLALITTPDVLLYILSHFRPSVPEIYQLEGPLTPRVGYKNGGHDFQRLRLVSDCRTTSLGCLPFNLLYRTPSLSKNYSPFYVRRFGICFLQKKKFLCFLIMGSLLINWFPPTSPTCLLNASTCLILLSGTCSISKSNSNERRLQLITGDCCYRRNCVEI